MRRESGAAARTISWDLAARDDDGLFDRYRDSLSDLYEVVDITPHARSNFATRTTATLFAEGGLGSAGAVGHALARTRRTIRTSGIDAIQITLNRAPMACECDGKGFLAAAGAVQFRDLAKPSASRFSTLDLVTLMVPRDKFAPNLRDDLHGRLFEPGTSAGRMLSGYLSLMAAQAEFMEPARGDDAIQGALLLIETALGQARPAPAEQAQVLYDAVRTQASHYMRAHLLDPSLSIEAIAAAIGVSRNTLFRAFAPGGVRRRLVELRLQRARAVLRQRGGRRETISDVAFRHGFRSVAHFSRLYRDYFGHPPSDNEPARGLPPGPPIDHTPVIESFRGRGEQAISRSPSERFA